MWFYSRNINSKFDEILNRYPVILITGSRSTGKELLLKLNNIEYNYVDLGDPSMKDLATNNPKSFLETYSTPLVINNIELVPSLIKYIQLIINNYDTTNTLYFLFKTTNYIDITNELNPLSKKLGILNCYPLSTREIYMKSTETFIPEMDWIFKRSKINLSFDELMSRIVRGSLPFLVKNDSSNSRQFYKKYVNDFIEKDIKNLVNFKNNDKFLTFLKAIAINTSLELNLSNIAKEVNVDNKTIKNWIKLLESFNLIYLITPYEKNDVGRITKKPKLYFLDTGLACYLSDFDNVVKLIKDNYLNQIFENYVVSEIVKSYLINNIDYKNHLFHYRDNHKNIIELLIFNNNVIYPNKISRLIMHKNNIVKHFQVIKGNNSIKKGSNSLICFDRNYKYLKEVNTISIDCI